MPILIWLMPSRLRSGQKDLLLLRLLVVFGISHSPLASTLDLRGLSRLVLVLGVCRHEGGLDLRGLVTVHLAGLVVLLLPLSADLLGYAAVSSETALG